jgi:uncharacterized LabA/DUF88 family protein
LAESTENRVAVYIDFDNIVISRYDEVHGKGEFSKDGARKFGMSGSSNERVPKRLDDARIDVGAILDYASFFGSIVATRAYADWSAPANSGYQPQLVQRAVDLVQLFSVSSTKNGADIRLAVDAVEDLFRLDDVTHVVIVAGDSDYISLAQRCRRLSRHVVGIGVAGSISKALRAACNEFINYDEIPGVLKIETAAERSLKTIPGTPQLVSEGEQPERSPEEVAVDLLIRAMRVLQSREDEEWALPSQVKLQMIGMDPAFNQKRLNYSTFTDFVAAHPEIVEIKAKSSPNERRLKLRSLD